MLISSIFSPSDCTPQALVDFEKLVIEGGAIHSKNCTKSDVLAKFFQVGCIGIILPPTPGLRPVDIGWRALFDYPASAPTPKAGVNETRSVAFKISLLKFGLAFWNCDLDL